MAVALKGRKLGPWPLGRDRVHADDPAHAVYRGSKERAPRLLQAVNMRLDAAGVPWRRPGLTELVAAASGLGLYAEAGLVLLQDGGTIKLVDTQTLGASDLITGLSASLPVRFHAHDGQVFWTNGVAWGRIEADGTATNWGMAVPPTPTLGTTAGGLPAGRVGVTCVYLDGNGVMSGAPESAWIDVNGAQDVTVDLTVNDASAEYVRVYATYANGPRPVQVAQVAAGALPVTLSELHTAGEVLKTQHLEGPVAGIEGLSSWGGYLLWWKGAFLAHSAGNSPHLFDLRTAVWEQDYPIVAAAGVGNAAEGACWVATERGMYRYSGTPGKDGFRRKPMDSRRYAKGFAVVDAEKLAGLQNVSGRVALFVSEDALAICTEDGQLLHPMQGRERWEVAGKRASIAYCEDGKFNEILVNLE